MDCYFKTIETIISMLSFSTYVWYSSFTSQSTLLNFRKCKSDEYLRLIKDHSITDILNELAASPVVVNHVINSLASQTKIPVQIAYQRTSALRNFFSTKHQMSFIAIYDDSYRLVIVLLDRFNRNIK